MYECDVCGVKSTDEDLDGFHEMLFALEDDAQEGGDE